MTSMIAILTYNRLPALQTTLRGIQEYCGNFPITVFDDYSYKDETRDFLVSSGISHVLSDRNLGVAGNTNRALKQFMDSTCDHLLLCNDDLIVKGDFASFYAKAHEDLGIGLWCFCDFTEEKYKWVTVPYKGYKIKLLPQMTGIMMSITRPVIEKIGYFDVRFPKFGCEHTCFTNRARTAGFLNLHKQPQHCLDVEHALLGHQEVETSVTGDERVLMDQQAARTMELAGTEYYCNESVYRHYRLENTPYAGGRNHIAGIPGYKLRNHFAFVNRD